MTSFYTKNDLHMLTVNISAQTRQLVQRHARRQRASQRSFLQDMLKAFLAAPTPLLAAPTGPKFAGAGLVRFHVDADLHAALQAHADAEHTTLRAVVYTAITNYFETHKHDQQTRSIATA